ncbi:MAG: alpha/beta hydrolase [Actinomycetota bacterium]
MKPSKSARRAVVLASVLLASLLAVSPSSARTGYPHHPTSEDLAQDLAWEPCFEEVTVETGTTFECADVLVPLDYDRIDLDLFDGGPLEGHPPYGDNQFRGLATEVAMIRIPATDPEARQGSILFNPGGPGGSGISFILGFGPAAGVFFGPDVTAQFDLVGFDPRGIGQSTPVRCFDTEDEAAQVFPPVAFPLTPKEVRQFRAADFALADACKNYPGTRLLARHQSTANVARDMDVMRASMGDESLNFLGLSYGTFVAATYANLFPENVRSVVADGVLDPIAWVNRPAQLPFSSRLRSDEGAQETLEEFFVQCEAAVPGNCAFAPDSRERYDALAAKLRQDGPIQLPNPFTGETEPFLYQDLIGFSLGNLYNPFGYAGFAEALAFFEAFAFGPPPAAAAAEAAVPAAALAFMEEQPYDNFVEGFPSVGCVDTNNPKSYERYTQAANAAEREFGYFGRIWTWASSPCIRWPFKDNDRYAGPFNADTANPVLVIGNLYDPATRYEGAQALRKLLPNSGLLTVDVPGHTSLGSSICAGIVTGQYFLDPSVATLVDGETCPSEFNVFDAVAGPPAPAAAAEAPVAAAASSDAEMADMVRLRAEIGDDLGMLPAGVRSVGG